MNISQGGGAAAVVRCSAALETLAGAMELSAAAAQNDVNDTVALRWAAASLHVCWAVAALNPQKQQSFPRDGEKCCVCCACLSPLTQRRPPRP